VTLDEALKMSSVHVAVQTEIVALDKLRHAEKKKKERELRVWERPFCAVRSLIRFDQLTNKPVYSTNVKTVGGQNVALSLTRSTQPEGWAPIDPMDAITALADLAEDDCLAARQGRIIERKKQFGMYQGREWACQRFLYLLEIGEDDDDRVFL
jgi:hypothetical protein